MDSLDIVKETTKETQLYDVKLKAIKIATNEFSKDLVYHNIAFINRIVDAIKDISEAEHNQLTLSQRFELQLSGWLCFLGLAQLDSFDITDDFESYTSECYKYSSLQCRTILAEVGVPAETCTNVIKIIEDVLVKRAYESLQAQIVIDAIYSDFSQPLGAKYLNKLYREMMLLGVLSYSTIKWITRASELLTRHFYQTNYGKENYEPAKIKLVHQLEKKIRDYKRTNETLLKREMNISASELKQLKKTLKKIKGRNERGIQTMFRTTSRNHYTLNQMLDRKANILISINTILLSVIITKAISGKPEFAIENLPVIIMMSTALISILFAILAIMPEKSHGEFTEAEIRNKEGNLLFFGNYFNMSIRDFTWGMLQMINDGEHLYMTMIRDLYYFGKQLAKKYRMLRLSLFFLGFGLTLSTIIFMIISNI